MELHRALMVAIVVGRWAPWIQASPTANSFASLTLAILLAGSDGADPAKVLDLPLQDLTPLADGLDDQAKHYLRNLLGLEKDYFSGARFF